MTHSRLSIVARSRGFRPILLGVILFWVCVFAAFSAECLPGTWSHPSNGFISPSTSDFCSWYASQVVGTPHTCSVSSTSASADVTYNGGPLEVWVRVGGAPVCDPEPEAEVAMSSEQLLSVIAGFFGVGLLMHGFVVGRGST